MCPFYMTSIAIGRDKVVGERMQGAVGKEGIHLQSMEREYLETSMHQRKKSAKKASKIDRRYARRTCNNEESRSGYSDNVSSKKREVLSQSRKK